MNITFNYDILHISNLKNTPSNIFKPHIDDHNFSLKICAKKNLKAVPKLEGNHHLIKCEGGRFQSPETRVGRTFSLTSTKNNKNKQLV